MISLQNVKRKDNIVFPTFTAIQNNTETMEGAIHSKVQAAY